jgi:two-component system sensor histidine kinase RegB
VVHQIIGRVCLVFLFGIKHLVGRSHGSDLVLTTGQAHKTLAKITDIAFQDLWRVARGINAHKNGLNVFASLSQSLQGRRYDLQFRWTHIRAISEAEEQQHGIAQKVLLGDGFPVLIHHGEGATNLGDAASADVVFVEIDKGIGTNRNGEQKCRDAKNHAGLECGAAILHDTLSSSFERLIQPTMTDTLSSLASRFAGLDRGRAPIRLRTLVRLRWLAVIGQAAAVMSVSIGLGYQLPLVMCLAAIGLSALLNIFLTLKWRSGQMLSTRATGLLLAYDVVQLAVLLYMTGGLENPFAFLFLVPVTVSATSLTLRWTIALGFMAFAFSTLLAVYHIPLPWRGGDAFALPPTYILGMWIAILCGTGFSAIYARRMAEEARVMSAALNATEMVLAREQRLSALDGLAAAAAHELGTPLATIALVAKELKREMPPSSAHAEDIDLLISQTARCREILAKLSNREQAEDTIYGQVKISSLLEDLVAPLRGSDVTIDVTCDGDGGEPVLLRNPGLAYGLSNILENAIDFAESKVIVSAHWTVSHISLLVSDDGAGFNEFIFDRLGDPFVTTRPGYDGTEQSEEKPGHEGMGLGLFIAKTLLERTGASVVLANLKTPDHGATVRMQWLRGSLDVATSKTLDAKPSQRQ